MSTRQVFDSGLATEFCLKKEQIKSLPGIAGHSKMSVDELLLEIVKRDTESTLENPACIGDMAVKKLKSMWKTGKCIKHGYSASSDLMRYRTTLALTSGEIYVLHQFAEYANRNVDEYLSERLKINIASLIAFYMDSTIISHEEGLRLYKIWDGDDLSYYKE
jgi:hypothetical protein